MRIERRAFLASHSDNREGARRRAALLMAAIATVALGIAFAAPAASAQESCPNAQGGSAVVEWGTNAQEQLGAGFKSPKENSPRTTLGLSNVTELQAGFNFVIALKGDCTLWAWGVNGRGQLGDGIARTPQAHPVAVKTLTNVREVATGKGAEAHVMALERDGTVWTWGASEFGERGNGEKNFESQAETAEPQIARHRYEPARVLLGNEPEVPLSGVEQISAGGERDYALLAGAGKEVLAWGQDSNGELGVQAPAGEEKKCNGEPAPKLAIPCVTLPGHVKTAGPSGLENLTGVEKVIAGVNAAYAVRSGGTELLGWGNNRSGQLMGAAEHTTSAVRLAWTPPEPIVEVSAGDGYALARLAGGAVYAWGQNNRQQLGFKSGEHAEECAKAKCVRAPVRVPSLSHVLQISAARGTTLALKREPEGKKVIYAFGSNTFYELLGLGPAYENSTGENGERIFPEASPTPITGLASISDASVGATSAAALIESGSPPAPVLTAQPITEALQVAWGALSEGYKFRWKPVGVKKFSKMYERRCEKGHLCAGSEHIPPIVEGQPTEALPPEPFEFFLNSGVIVTEREKELVRVNRIRSIAATPRPPEGAPENITPPALPNSARENQPEPLVATEGAWTNSPTSYSFEWLRCDSFAEPGQEEEFGEECDPIKEGERLHEGSTYTPTAADVGHALRISVKATNAKGWSKAASAAATAVIVRGSQPDEAREVPPAPENLTAPVLENALGGKESALQGEQLTVHPATWENEPLPALTHDRWVRCASLTGEGELASTCHPIYDPPATEGGEPTKHEGTSYTTRPEDLGQYIEVKELAGNSGGYGAAISNPVFVEASGAPANEAAPSIEGAEGKYFQVDQRLTANPGKWSGNPTGFTYKWERCSGTSCAEIREKEGTKQETPATGFTYKVQPGDVQHTIVVQVTASNKRGTGGPVPSAPTPEVPMPPRAPVNEVAPTISGVAKQGGELKVTPGRWSFESFSETGYEYPKEFKDQWFRCHTEMVNGKEKEVCSAIKGTLEGGSAPLSASYVPTQEDVGMFIKVKETVKVPNSELKAETGHVGPIVAAPPTNTSPPTVEGFAMEGQTLTERNGNWTAQPTSYAYQWERCTGGECAPIEIKAGSEEKPAIEQTYTLAEEDYGHTIRVKETASNASGPGAAANSAPTGEVLPEEPAARQAPKVLSATQPPKQGQQLTGVAAAWAHHATRYSYAWLRCDSAGAHCMEVAGVASQATQSIAPYELTREDVGHTLRIEEDAYNASGYGSALSQPSEVVVIALPVVAALAPAKGPSAGGTSVTITGENLGGATGVEFGLLQAASFKVNSPTSITAVSPAGSGTVHVVVTTGVGMSATGEHDLFSYVPPPSVTKVEPPQGPEAGGASVTITGEGLAEATAVRFAASNAPSFEVLSARSIRASAPAGVGTVDVSVTTPYGSSTLGAADHYTYVPAPLVTKVTPNSGSTLGAEAVTITGKNLGGATAVKFGSLAAESVKVESATKLVAHSPAMAAGKVDVTVTTPGGTSAISTKDAFSYTPVIASVNPSKGLPVGGTAVTVKGSGFALGTTATTFKFGGTKASKVSCASSTECTVTSPKHAEGTVDVVATVNEVNSPKSAQDQFTYSLV